MNDQEKALKLIMKKCLNSEYLLSLGINRRPTLQEFKKKIPIVTYHELEPYINRAYAGEKNVLSAEPILIWGMTSGTTGKPKLIPHNKSSLKIYKQKMNLFFLRIILSNPSIINGKFLILTGKHCNWKSPDGKIVGSISGIMASKIPGLFKKMILYDSQTLDKLPDDKRLNYIAKEAQNENISVIASSSVTYLLGFFDELKRIVKKDVMDIWPNLKIISCPCGGHYRTQIDEISKMLPNVKILDVGLGATEGYFFVSVKGTEPIGIPNSKEYLIELLDSNSKKLYSLNEAELNKKYELVISSVNGILRYRMGDFVHVIRKNNKTMLKFLEKKLSEFSIYGERMNLEQLKEAFSSVKSKFLLDKDKFLFITPSKIKKFNKYYLLIPSKEIKGFEKAIEQKMQEKNINYKNIISMTKLLDPIKVIFLSEKEFNRVLESVHENKFLGQGRKKEVYTPDKESFYRFLQSYE